MEIIPHVYQITSPVVNIPLIAEEELTLVDTGMPGSSSRIINFIHSLGRSAEEITLIIITHNHLDHIGGLAGLRKFTKAKVALHKADINAVDNKSAYPKALGWLLHIPPFSALRPLLYPRPHQIDIELEGGEILSPLGGLKVIHTPGHTPGSISLFFPQKKLLIVGDALNNSFRRLSLPPKLSSADLTQDLDSVRRIARLDFDTLCFGHGKPLTKHASAKVQDLIRRQGDEVNGSVV